MQFHQRSTSAISLGSQQFLTLEISRVTLSGTARKILTCAAASVRPRISAAASAKTSSAWHGAVFSIFLDYRRFPCVPMTSLGWYSSTFLITSVVTSSFQLDFPQDKKNRQKFSKNSIKAPAFDTFPKRCFCPPKRWHALEDRCSWLKELQGLNFRSRPLGMPGCACRILHLSGRSKRRKTLTLSSLRTGMSFCRLRLSSAKFVGTMV